MEFYIVEAFKIFEKIVELNQFQKFLLDPSKIFELPAFIEWIKSFRWTPKKSAQNGKKCDFLIEKFFEDISDDIHFLYALLSINSNVPEEKKACFFIPLLCSDKKIYTDLPEQFKSSFNIKTESEDREIYLYQAEYYRVFWKNLFNQTSKNKNFRLIISKEYEEFLSALKNETFKIDVLGEGDTTNVVLNFQIPDHEPILCKIYKNTSSNLEIPLLDHLFKTNFDHIPRIFGSIGISSNCLNEKRSIKVLFREFLESQNDAGSIFWNELNDFFTSHLNDIPKNSSEYSQEMFRKLFPKSSSYADKIGNIMNEMHEKLRTHADMESEISSDKNDNSILLSNFFIEDEFDENDLLSLRNLLMNIIQDIYSQIKLQYEPNSEENNIDKILKSIQYFIENLVLEDLIKSPYLNKQPIHQDLHFSQMIQIDDLKRDPIFIDFEGDPLLPEPYKFKKYPYFQDIASTLRAFSYIKFNSLMAPINKIFESNKIFDFFHELHGDSNNSLISSFKSSIVQYSLGLYLFSNLEKQKTPKFFLNFAESLMVDFSKNLNIDLQEIDKIVGKIREIEMFKDILSFSKYWEKHMSNEILHGYFSKSNQNKVNSKELEYQKNRVLKIFLFRRALFELKYERTYRPMNQIVPILGLIDLFLSN